MSTAISRGIAVRGNASPEELAVVLAALASLRPVPAAAPDGYARWRAARRRALARAVPGNRITTR